MPVTIIDTLQRGGLGTSPFPVIKEDDSRLSYSTVADLASRDIIPEWKRLPFMRVHVIGEATDYRLGADVTIAGQIWTEVADGGGGGGLFQLLSEKNQPSGYVGLEANSKINPIYIDNIYANNSFVVATLVARNALTTVTGDIVTVTDTSQIFVKLNNNPPTNVDADFAELLFPGAVLSVNGQIGVVTITIANLLAVPQNATDLNNFINTSTAVLALNGVTATHTIQIAALQADVAALQAAIGSNAGIPDYDPLLTYTLNQAVKFQEVSGRYNLYVADNNIAAGEIPGVDPDWLRIGDYYTTAENDALLLNKANLVGGVVPINETQPASLIMSYVVNNLASRNALTPQTTGMRVYVTDNVTSYIYQPGHPLADPQGFVKEFSGLEAAENGLNISTPGTVQWGGPLFEDTYIELLDTTSYFNLHPGTAVGGDAYFDLYFESLTNFSELFLMHDVVFFMQDGSAIQLDPTGIEITSNPGNILISGQALNINSLTGEINLVAADGLVLNAAVHIDLISGNTMAITGNSIGIFSIVTDIIVNAQTNIAVIAQGDIAITTVAGNLDLNAAGAYLLKGIPAASPTTMFFRGDGTWAVPPGAGVTDHFKGAFTDLAALEAAFPEADPGDYALVDVGAADAVLYIWDETDTQWIASGVTTIVPDADETTKGVVEEATQDETDQGIPIGGTGARLYVNPAKLSEGVGTGLFGRGYWNYNNSITPGPSSGQFRLNSLTMATATIMYLHELTNSNEDVSNFLAALKFGDVFYVQQRNDATRWFRATINGTLTDNGSYWTIPIKMVANSGIIMQPNAVSLVRVTVQGQGESSAFLTEYFTGNSIATVFNIPGTSPIQIIAVYVGGQRLVEAVHYTKDDALRTVTITPAIATGIGIDVEYISNVEALDISTIAHWNETTWGLARVATQVETNAGASDDRGVTPLKLKTWWDSVKTIAATLADLITGTSTTTHITPAGLKSYTDPLRNAAAVSAGTATLNCANKVTVNFEDTATQSANFTIAFSNNSNAEEITYSTFMTGTRVITMPSNVIMEVAEEGLRWANATKNLTLICGTAAPVEFSWKRINGNKFLLRVGGPYYAA